jgi:ribose transport system permease protein
LVNALLIVGLRINPVIATLGSLYVSRGVANLLTDGKPVHGVPADYGSLGTGFVGLVPRPVLIMLVVVVTLSVLQSRTVLGRYAAAIGSSTEAATLAGIRVERVRMLLYVLTGAAAGLGGIIVSSRLNSGQPTAATGFEFDVIVACILGGTTLRGGEGTIGGSVVGALIVGVLNNGLNLLGVQTFWQTIVQGTILVLAVALDLFIRERRTGPGRQRRPHGEQSRAHTATDRGDPDDPPGSVPTHRRPDRVG